MLPAQVMRTARNHIAATTTKTMTSEAGPFENATMVVVTTTLVKAMMTPTVLVMSGFVFCTEAIARYTTMLALLPEQLHGTLPFAFQS